MKERIKKKFCVTYYVNKVHMYRETYEKDIIETIVDNYGILCLNRRHAEQGLYHKKLREITTKYHSDHRKHRYMN